MHKYTEVENSSIRFVKGGMNVLHIALNYVLNFWYFGFPELGVTGVAISSVIGRALAAVVFIWLLTKALAVKVNRWKSRKWERFAIVTKDA